MHSTDHTPAGRQHPEDPAEGPDVEPEIEPRPSTVPMEGEQPDVDEEP